MADYAKLSETEAFQIKSFNKKFYQKWDDDQKKYVRSDTPAKEHSQIFEFTVFIKKDGSVKEMILQLSGAQFQQCLCACFDGEMASPAGNSFAVRNNGKTKKDIRYFINLIEK